MSGTITTPGAPPTRQRRRWTIDEFDRLVAEGFLREGGGAYLWDGEIIELMPENPPHVNATMCLLELLVARFPAAEWTVNLGKPVVLGGGYKPQPDLSVLRGPRSTYRNRTPTAEDVALLVEVADSTYSEDVGEFLRAYAGAGIARYWVVNIHARRIEVHADPGRAGDGTPVYLARSEYGLDTIVPLDGIGGGDFAPEAVAVIDVLRDSIDPNGAGV